MIVIQEQEFRRFADYIKVNYGIHFKNEKKTLVEGRLGQVLTSMNMGSLTEYMEYVTTDKTGQAAAVMLDRITTNYTFFMREPEHFHFFRDRVLPYLSQTAKDRDLRIWSAACSTGEEPYTLAMLIDEFFGSNKAAWDTKILATDISQGVLASAMSGVYGKEKIADLPDGWKKRYFKPLDSERCILSEKIRNEVIFSNINLMNTSFPFKRKMHVIFCRNVMIYFDNDTKDRLAERLYDITEPGGFLFIGHSESLNREATRYRYVMPAVYRKE
ncbi:CheR family methyltransferase [Lacrimispora defluvii]|uniref:protein-glutamate O-methyltransferase n=1 Tax=Lacrimispora defluvii TaxID=2719233 RepID=A0ABX1VYE5_9FIRM|nr:protein-glutamate O-methyltransferase CheR [Lacrimispora defluvii]NNJ32809.1 protein-glutamate O-methyltransferase CheR [Lacrimispora defluvii]